MKKFEGAASKDMEKIQRLYSQEIIKFGMFLQEMEQKFKKFIKKKLKTNQKYLK